MDIQGVSITLHEPSEGAVDEFNHPVIVYSDSTVENVLVGEPSTQDITDTYNLYGKRVAYMLAVPKGDTHKWVNAKVTLPAPFEGTYRTIGYPTAGIESNIPLKWNKKVKIERVGEYEQDEN